MHAINDIESHNANHLHTVQVITTTTHKLLPTTFLDSKTLKVAIYNYCLPISHLLLKA